ncbi:MAG: PAS domain S-box protein [Spirochaetia bacterium]|jgi:PAS domain S-box-containing protein
MAKRVSEPRAAADKHRSIFEHSAVSLWEEDIAGLRALIKEWTGKTHDLGEYLRAHPSAIRKGLRAIRVVDVNEATVRLYEAKSRKDLLGPLDITLDPEATNNFIELFTAVAEGRTSVEQESSARTLTGKRLDLLIKVFIPVKDDAYQYMLVNVIDITNYKRLEKELRQERSLLRAVINNHPDAIFLKDRESRFVLANKAVAEIMQAGEPENLIGKTDRDFYPEAMTREFEADERGVIQEGRKLVNKEEPKPVAGKLHWILTTKVPLFDAEGGITGLVGVSRDITSLKEAQEALRQSEERYRSLVENLGVGILISDESGMITLTNPAVGQIFGLPRGASRGKNLKDFLSEKEYARVRSEIASRKQGDRSSYEVTIIRADGETRRVALTAVSRFNPAGRFMGTFATLQDVTDRRKTEEELSRQRLLVQTLMDGIPDYIYFKDRESRFILNNKAHAKAMGAKDPAEMLGKTDFDYFTQNHAQKAFDDEQRIIRTGQPLIDDVEQETWPDRPSTWVTSTKMPLLDQNGEVLGTFGISRDITERRRMEENTMRLAAMVESSNDAIVGIDLNDMVTSWNKGAEKVFGYTAEEMVGRSINPLLSPDMLSQEPVLRDKLQQEGSAVHMEGTVTRKDGKSIHVSTSISFVKDPAGQIVGITCISRDVTNQRALQAQIIRAQRLESLATLAAGIAHQFNNINTAVKGYLDLLAQDSGLQTTPRAYLQEALKGVQRAVGITDRLQGLTGAAASSHETLSLEETVPAILPLFSRELETDGVSLGTDFRETPRVRASHDMVSFIVTSLMTNSLQALIGCEKRSITITTRGEPEYACLEVSDTGCGISAENLPRIFTPFFTTKGEWAAPGSSQARVKGIGLSLAVCQSTVAESGGWIEVESTPANGATFRVWLPAANTGQPAR